MSDVVKPDKEEEEEGEEPGEGERLLNGEVVWEPSRLFRMVFLFFTCFYCLGSQVPYGAPSAMGPAFTAFYSMSATQMGVLFGVWSVPNLPLAFIVGIFVDRAGPNWSSFLLNVSIVVGAAIMVLSAYLTNLNSMYWTLLVGFGVFGIGSGVISLAQQVHLTNWFKGKELAFSFGCSSMILRLATIVNYNLCPTLAADHGVAVALYWPFSVTILSLFCGLVSVWMDVYRTKRMKHVATVLPIRLWPHLKRTAREFRYMTSRFWLLCCLVTTSSCAEFLYEMYAELMWAPPNEYLPAGMVISEVQSGQIISVASIVIVIVCPFASALVDKIGNYPWFMVIASITGCGAAAMLIATAYVPATWWLWPYFLTAAYGFSYGVRVSVTWPCVAFLVSDQVLGTAFGFICGCLYLGLFILPYVIGALFDKYNSWFPSCLVLGILSVISLTCSILIMVIDNRTDKILKWPDGRGRPKATESGPTADAVLERTHSGGPVGAVLRSTSADGSNTLRARSLSGTNKAERDRSKTFGAQRTYDATAHIVPPPLLVPGGVSTMN